MTPPNAGSVSAVPSGSAGEPTPTEERDAPKPVGWILLDRIGGAYRSHLYYNERMARAALEGIVWHSRDRYTVRAVYAGEPNG